MKKVVNGKLGKVIDNAAGVWRAVVGLMLVGWQGRAFSQTATSPATNSNFGLGTGSSFLTEGKDLVANGASTMSTIIIGVGVVWIGWMTISKFQEWRNGKADIGEVGVVAFGGSALLLFIAFLFNKAVDVFA